MVASGCCWVPGVVGDVEGGRFLMVWMDVAGDWRASGLWAVSSLVALESLGGSLVP